MGCNGSRRTISGIVKPYDFEALNDENSSTFDVKTCSRLWPGKVHVATSKTPGKQASGVRYRWGKTRHSTDLSVMDQKKRNNGMLERQRRELQNLQAFRADTKGAIYNIHELQGTTQIGATRGNMNMSNMYEAGYVVSGEFRPGMNIQVPENIPSATVHEVCDPYNVNFSAAVPMINPVFGYLSSPIVMGKKPEDEDPKIIAGNSRHTSNKVSYSIPQRENQTFAESPEILEHGYLSSKSTETLMTKNGEGSFSDFEPFKSSCPFGLGAHSLSQILKGSFSDDSDTMSNQEQREGEIQIDKTENENFEHIVKEVNMQFSSSSSEIDLNTVIAETSQNYKQNFQSNEQLAGR